MSLYSSLLVFCQFALLIYLSLTGLIGKSIISITVQGLGIFVALWGIIAMRLGQFNIQPEVKASQLIERGPYTWIRNPMYLGILLVMIPSVIDQYTSLRVLAVILLSVVLGLKVLREEQLLAIHFGEVYVAYKKRTKRFLPFIF